jgi:hypothetical protein
MYGQKIHYRDGQSFGQSTQFSGDDFPNRNKFQRYDANGKFNISGALKANTEHIQSDVTSTFSSGLLAAIGCVITDNGYIYRIPTGTTSISIIKYLNDTTEFLTP